MRDSMCIRTKGSSICHCEELFGKLRISSGDEESRVRDSSNSGSPLRSE